MLHRYNSVFKDIPLGDFKWTWKVSVDRGPLLEVTKTVFMCVSR